ncbi:hypothetical protein BLA27_09825 [Brucella cytisi]|uniref:Uncharacterized protein n=1 Tax=Brucella cytisi TaxID=407152 RepID=A0A1J6I6Z7_9HYPH|nr:hypothetical protein BLA27_09825 [Brucella cytisi]
MNVTELQRRHDCSIHSKRATLQEDRTGIVVVFRELQFYFQSRAGFIASLDRSVSKVGRTFNCSKG